MDPVKDDVKPQDAESAPASSAGEKVQESKTDVKQTIDDEATRLVTEALKSGASTGDEEEADEGEKAESGSVEEQDEKPEGEVEEEPSKDEEDPEGAEGDKDAEDEPADKKHEEHVPYARFKEVNEKLTSIEPWAKAQQELTQYCQKSNISQEQFSGALNLLATLNTNPEQALQQLESFVSELKQAVGQELPSDLKTELSEAKAELDDGIITKGRYEAIEKRLKEVSTLRRQSSIQQQQSQLSSQQQAVGEQQQLTNALQTWSTSKQAKDMDFKPKAKPEDPDGKFEDFLGKNTLLWVQSPPKTVADAVALADKAYAAVNQMAKRYAPPKAKKVITSTGTQGRTSANGEPKSLDDVVAAIGRKHGYNI